MQPNTRRKLQVFVSSTYHDLLDDRQAAVAAILKAGHIPAGMELFTAGDKSQLETIKRWIDDCDIFMLILAGRYGSLEPESGLSYTEIEYNYALAQNKPFFSVVMEDEALNERSKSDPRTYLEQHEPKKLDTFRAKVKSSMCSFYKDANGIKLAVHESLPELQREHSLSGWIPAATVPDATVLVAEIGRLTDENKQLSVELKAASDALSQGGRSYNDKEMGSLALRLGERPFEVDPTIKNITKIQQTMASITLDVEAILPEGHLPEPNELGAFYVCASAFATGVRGRLTSLTVNGLNLAPCLQMWLLEELIEVEDRSEVSSELPQPFFMRGMVLYQVTARGKSFYRWINSLGNSVPYGV